MDSLFGIPLTSIMIGLLILLAVALGAVGYVALRQPLLLRMGLRNIRRRASQTTLIVVGLMLSTLIISAAFATGDTVGYSITNEVYNQLQETDLVISFDPDRAEVGAPQHLTNADVEAFRAQFASNPDIDGITSAVEFGAPVINTERRLSEPTARVLGVDPATVDQFGGLRLLNGEHVSATSLTDTVAYITQDLADSIDSGAGDTVTIFFDNQPYQFQIGNVIQDVAATVQVFGSGGGGALVTTIETARSITNRPDEVDSIAVSVAGGVRNNLDRTDAVESEINDYLDTPGAIPAQVATTKPELVDLAATIGSFFVTFFVLFGLFSIAAGVLLIFLIFIMLAAERRSEMGMARAIGMTRLHLTESFLAEGMAYNLGSAAVGGLLGIGVAYILILVMGQIFGDDAGFSIAFHVNPQGFVVAYSLGVVLTFITVVFSSWRASNLNIVRAIRDLPEPNPLRDSQSSLRGLWRAALGALWYLMWIGMASLWVVAGIALFAIGLGTFGLGMIAGLLLAAFFIAGARSCAKPWSEVRGLRRIIYLLWWVAFSVLALVTWLLLRTRAWANRYRNAGGWAVWMVIFGVLFTYLGGWVWGQAFAYTAGTTLFVFAIAMLAVYFGMAARPAFTTAGLLLVWYWLLPLPFSLFGKDGWTDPVGGLVKLLGLPETKEINGNIEMFFVSGISITAAATIVVVFNAGWFLGAANRLGALLGGAMPAVRTAISYPLASRFRTGMTLSMFCLVVFSLVVMSTLNSNFTQLFLGEDARAGFDVIVRTSANNPIDNLEADLQAAGYDTAANIEGVGRFTSLFIDGREQNAATTADDNGYRSLLVQGADPELFRLGRIPLQLRAAGYETDQQVFDAIDADPTLAIIDANLLTIPGQIGVGDDAFRLEETEADLRDTAWQPIPVTIRDPETGMEQTLNIIGVVEPQVTAVLFEFSAIITSEQAISGFENDGHVFLVNTVDGSDAAALRVARDIESALLERGAQSDSIPDLIDTAAGQSTAFQLLFEGFMGLGLIVGIAALGVIAFRTVVERRQQIGMLRAIGYTRRLIALSFFLESSFIALTGTAMGFLLGLALSYNLLTSPDFTGGTEIDFSVPWFRLALIGGIAYGASALMTLIPARAASRVPVAEALRYE
ncbi:MAG: FtsX-like permease family protein [Dehalococcoidia bacterium]